MTGCHPTPRQPPAFPPLNSSVWTCLRVGIAYRLVDAMRKNLTPNNDVGVVAYFRTKMDEPAPRMPR